MVKLTEQRFVDFLKTVSETGMGYTIATVILKDGREFAQVVLGWDSIEKIKGLDTIPFTESDIDSIEVTHDKW